MQPKQTCTYNIHAEHYTDTKSKPYMYMCIIYIYVVKGYDSGDTAHECSN